MTLSSRFVQHLVSFRLRMTFVNCCTVNLNFYCRSFAFLVDNAHACTLSGEKRVERVSCVYLNFSSAGTLLFAFHFQISIPTQKISDLISVWVRPTPVCYAIATTRETYSVLSHGVLSRIVALLKGFTADKKYSSILCSS